MEKFNNVNELRRFYKKFEKQSLENLFNHISEKYPEIKINTNKGAVGQILEALIGNAPNSDPNPDVKNINVELKVLPLRKISNKIQPKERSKIKSINYNKIVDENWDTSDVKEKMTKILFLLYNHPTGKTFKDWKEFIFNGTLLYELDNHSPQVVKEDWEGIKYKIKTEKADQLSESHSKILGASTSGSGKLVKYGNKKEAKQRSYSLKHNYLKLFFDENKANQKYSSLNLESKQEPHKYVIEKFNKELLNKNLNTIVNKYQVKFSPNAKSSFSLLLNRVLKVDDNSKIRELEENGIVIKTIPVSKENRPWEAMSFPKFSLVDLMFEEWDGEEFNEAIFKNIISKPFIFIPIIKEKIKIKNKNGKIKYKFKDWKTWEIGKSVYWQASEAELEIIKKEWLKAKNIVKKGIKVTQVKHGKGTRQENNLLKSSETKIIHIRPHANNSNDIDIPYFQHSKSKISWQSFWLNKKYTEKIIKSKLY